MLCPVWGILFLLMPHLKQFCLLGDKRKGEWEEGRAKTLREIALEVAEPVGWAQRKPRTKRVKRCDVGRSCRRHLNLSTERFHQEAPMLGSEM